MCFSGLILIMIPVKGAKGINMNKLSPSGRVQLQPGVRDRELAIEHSHLFCREADRLFGVDLCPTRYIGGLFHGQGL